MNKLESLLKKFDEKSMKMSDLRFTFYILSISFVLHVVAILMHILIYSVDSDIVSAVDNHSKYLMVVFLSLVVFIPYIETIIFHAAPLGLYSMLKKKFQIEMKWDFLAGGACGLIFGILHATTSGLWLKGVSFTLIGCLYSYAFFRYRRMDKKGSYGIWAIHALNNSVVFFSIAIDRIISLN